MLMTIFAMLLWPAFAAPRKPAACALGKPRRAPAQGIHHSVAAL
jgi:hypothetical protein